MSVPPPLEWFAGIILAILVNVTSNWLPKKWQGPFLRWGWFATFWYFAWLVLSIDAVERALRTFHGSRISYLIAGLISLIVGVAVWAVINRFIPNPPPDPIPKIITVTPAEIDLNPAFGRNPEYQGLLKHEINVLNHTDEPYYQIWIKLVADFQRAADLRLELPPADTQLGPVRVTSKAFAFMGTDHEKQRAMLVLIPRLGPRTPLTFRLANVAPPPANEPLKIRILLLTFRKDPVPIYEGKKETKTFMGTPFQFPEDDFQVEALGMGFDVKNLALSGKEEQRSAKQAEQTIRKKATPKRARKK